MNAIHTKKNSKMKAAYLRENKIELIRNKIIELCDKSFYDGGIVNDADLDDIEEIIRSIAK